MVLFLWQLYRNWSISYPSEHMWKEIYYINTPFFQSLTQYFQIESRVLYQYLQPKITSSDLNYTIFSLFPFHTGQCHITYLFRQSDGWRVVLTSWLFMLDSVGVRSTHHIMFIAKSSLGRCIGSSRTQIQEIKLLPHFHLYMSFCWTSLSLVISCF